MVIDKLSDKTFSKVFCKVHGVCLAILFVFFAGFFSSCSTTVKYKVSRPAKLSPYGIKTIAVLPYEPKSEKSTSASPQAV